MMNMSCIFSLLGWNAFTFSSCILAIIGIVLIRKVFQPYSKILPKNESVFITGCDSGIGHQCALLYDKLGFRVFAGCLQPDGKGAKKLQEKTTNLRVIDLDVTNEQKVNEAFETVSALTKNSGLWALVNNAGVLCYGEFDWCTWNQCLKQIDVNLLGNIRIIKTFLPLIQKRKGRIVTITSINGLLAFPGQAVYCASKFALEGLCDSLRMEFYRHGIKMISIQLGDFARLTNIFSEHEKNVEEMWAAMSEDQRCREEKYFRKFHEIALARHGLAGPVSFENSRLFRDLKNSVLSDRPQSRYLCMPFIQGIVLRTLLLLPSSMTDYLLRKVFETVFKSSDS